MTLRFSAASYHSLCDGLATRDKDLAAVLTTYGYPPLWTRPNTFETLVHIILEQQVSLASALAALNKLREKISVVSPANFLALTDEEVRACYFSRQKTIYVRALAAAIAGGTLSLSELEDAPDAVVRSRLMALKGIGHWTTDVYLMFVLRHADVFPLGDLAAINALRTVKKISREPGREQLQALTEKWKPHRTIAAMILWHFYLSSRAKPSAK